MAGAAELQLVENLVVDGNALGAKKPAKKKLGARLWLSIDENGATEFVEADKHVVSQRASIPLRDLRVMGPLFSHSAVIMGRSRAMLVNLEHIKSIITADEALILNPLDEEVSPFVEKVKKMLRSPSLSAPPSRDDMSSLLPSFPNGSKLTQINTTANGGQPELPFEFRILELILEEALMQLDVGTKELESEGTAAMEEFRKSVTTKSLEKVRHIKSRMTRLIARVQNVREELEQLLDDDDDMRELYLTRTKQQFALARAPDSPSAASSAKGSGRSSMRATLLGSFQAQHSDTAGASDVEELEMLLEAYFMQADGYRNKLNNLREFIDDTEGIVNIELDHRRNQLIEFDMHLNSSSVVIGVALVFLGSCSMNVPNWLYNLPDPSGYTYSMIILYSFCACIFVGLQAYMRWHNLLL